MHQIVKQVQDRIMIKNGGEKKRRRKKNLKKKVKRSTIKKLIFYIYIVFAI